MEVRNFVVRTSTEANSELRAYAQSVYGWVTILMNIAGKN